MQCIYETFTQPASLTAAGSTSAKQILKDKMYVPRVIQCEFENEINILLLKENGFS